MSLGELVLIKTLLDYWKGGCQLADKGRSFISLYVARHGQVFRASCRCVCVGGGGEACSSVNTVISKPWVGNSGKH